MSSADWIKLIVGIAIAVAVIGLALLHWWFDPDLRRWRAFDTEIEVREPVPDNEMISRYFAEDDVSPDVPANVRRIFARHMDYPAEKLLPDDNFAFFWAELDMVDLIRELESRFGIAITQADAEPTPCTIRAVSTLVANKLGKLDEGK